MVAIPKIPPARVVRAAEAVRERVQRLHRRMVPAPIALLEMVWGCQVTQALYVAAKLGIADVLAGGPLTSEEIARRVDASPDGIFRLLRALASRGVFAARRDGRYELTPLADTLRTDAPVSTRSARRGCAARSRCPAPPRPSRTPCSSTESSTPSSRSRRQR